MVLLPLVVLEIGKPLSHVLEYNCKESDVESIRKRNSERGNKWYIFCFFEFVPFVVRIFRMNHAVGSHAHKQYGYWQTDKQEPQIGVFARHAHHVTEISVNLQLRSEF